MLSPAEDSRPGAWVGETLRGFAQDVGSVVPPVFEAYVRVFHPAWRGAEERRPVTWSEVAIANGRTVHPEMQFHALVPGGYIDRAGNVLDRQRGLWDGPPEEGSLARSIIEKLLPILGEHTEMPERCWFAFWNGWGIPVRLVPQKRFSRTRHASETPDQRALRERWKAPTFSIPGRELLLFSGSLEDALEGFYDPYDSGDFQSASLWWPDDRRWCVATEIDFMSTYIGGSQECAESILQIADIEALPAGSGDAITAAADTVNPNLFTD